MSGALEAVHGVSRPASGGAGGPWSAAGFAPGAEACAASVACAPASDASLEFASSADAAGFTPRALATAIAPSAAPSAFARLLAGPLRELDASVSTAEAALRGLAAGRPVELHALMIEVERARLGVQTFVQVRNKLVESYQDLMRMQL